MSGIRISCELHILMQTHWHIQTKHLGTLLNSSEKAAEKIKEIYNIPK